MPRYSQQSKFVGHPLLRRRLNRRGRVRAEWLVVALVILLSLGLFTVWVNNARIEARQVTCDQRMTQLGRAIVLHELHRYRLPAYREQTKGKNDGWGFAVLPFVRATTEMDESGNLRLLEMGPYDQQRQEFLTADSNGDQDWKLYVADFVCPSDRREELFGKEPITSFSLNTGMPDAREPGDKLPPDWKANGVFQDATSDYAESNSMKEIQEADGRSATLMILENVDARHWTRGIESEVGIVWTDAVVDNNPAPGKLLLPINDRIGQGDGTMLFARPSSHHKRGVNVLYCDGRVEVLHPGIDYLVFTFLMTSNTEKVLKAGSRDPVAEPYRPRVKDETKPK